MQNEEITEVLKIFNNGWNKQVILYGPPGTSKTYSATIIAAELLAGIDPDEKNPCEKLRDALKGLVEMQQEKSSPKTDAEQQASSKLSTVELTNEENKGVKTLDQGVNVEQEDLYECASQYLKYCQNYKLVQFHPSYSYEDFVRGITVKPAEKNIEYVVEPKGIEKFYRDGQEFIDKNKNNDYFKNEKRKRMVLVIDEINRAPLASVLGELIYGLEYREEKISTPYELSEEYKEKHKNMDFDLKIPDNLYIIGTMNTADRSIGSIDYAVRRRFAFVQVNSTEAGIRDSWNKIGELALKLYTNLMDEKKGIFADDCLEDSEMDVNDIKIGHTYFMGNKNVAENDEEAYLAYRLKYQIIPIYEEYIKDGIIKREGMNRLYKIIRDEGVEELTEVIPEKWREKNSGNSGSTAG